MKQVLGKKQTSSNEDFVKAWQNIEQLVSLEEAERLVASTVSDIRQKTAGHNVAYAWSGGKDSLALQVVCERAGIRRCVFCTAPELEYPDFLRWVYRNQPQGMMTITLDKLNLKWLSEHQDMLFPSEAKMNSRWMEKLQWAGQREYCKRTGIKFLILGRRSQDGNYVGKAGSNIYTTGDGQIRYNPIAHWKHEEVLAVIHYFLHDNIPWALYGTKDGWTKGTGLWSEREYSWQEVYDIDPGVVRTAAQYITSARDFLTSISK